jgi:hypothetical protein
MKKEAMTKHLIACCCIKDYDPYFTNHIPRQLYKGGKEDRGAVSDGKSEQDASIAEKTAVVQEEEAVRHGS